MPFHLRMTKKHAGVLQNNDLTEKYDKRTIN